MKAIYTEAAKQELENFKVRQQQLLEELVAERKLVFGDDVLEITASDIKDASQRIRPYRLNTHRSMYTELVTRVYIVIGLCMMAGAFLYPEIQTIFIENKTQALLFLTGATMATVGWFFKFWVEVRQKRFVEEAEKYLAIEKIQRASSDEKPPHEQ